MGELTKPHNIPSCVDNEGHNFQPLNKKTVYCTRCGGSVKYTKENK